jgi:hypothetical protein
MSTITADSALHKVLAEVSEITEVHDKDGNFLGLFTPKAKAEEWIYAKVRQLFDPKETERRLREEGGQGCTLEEIKKRLGILEVQ